MMNGFITIIFLFPPKKNSGNMRCEVNGCTAFRANCMERHEEYVLTIRSRESNIIHLLLGINRLV